MKSCLGLLFMLLLFVVVIGGGALIWYLSDTAEFTQAGAAGTAGTDHAPKATPVNPGANTHPPQAILVRPDPKIPARPPQAIPVPHSDRR